MANTIELILKSIDDLTGDLKAVEAGLGRLDKTQTKVADSSKEAADSSGNLAASLGILATTIGPLNGAFDNFSRGLLQLAHFLKAGAIPAAVGAIGAAAVLTAKSFADLGTELTRLERVTGISVASLSGLKVIAEQNESSLGELSIALRTLNRVLGQAVTQGGEARQQLIQLGITEQQLTEFYGDSEAALEAVAKRISALPSIIEKNRLAVQFFGRSGRDLLITLDEIAKNGLEGVRQKAEDLGLLMSGKAAAAGKQFNDNLTTIKQNLESLKISLGGPLLVLLNDFIALLTRVASFGTIKIEFLGAAGRLFDGPKIADSLSKAIKAGQDAAELEKSVARDVARGMGIGSKEGVQKIIDEIRSAETTEALAEVVEEGMGKGGRQAVKAIQDARREAARLDNRAQEEARNKEEKAADEKKKVQNEFAKQLEKQVAGLNAELAKSVAQSQIQIAGQLLEKTGNFDAFLGRVKKSIAEIRAASRVSIDLQFTEESEKGDSVAAGKVRAARLAQITQQTKELELAALRQVAEFREKIADRRVKLEQDHQSAIADGAQAELDFARKTLELGKDDISTLEQIVAETDKIAERMRALNQIKLDELNARIQELRQKLDFSSLPTGSQAALAKALGVDILPLTAEQIREINIDIVKLTTEAQKTKTEFLGISNAASDLAKQIAEVRLFAGIEAQSIRLKTQLDEINDQIDDIKTNAAIESLSDSSITVPWNKVLELSKQIDKVQQNILANDIERQKIAVDIARRTLDGSQARQNQLEIEIARLTQLQSQARLALGKAEKEALANFAREVDDIAGNMAKNFVDRLIEGLEGGKDAFKKIFQGLGRTIAADLLQQGTKSLLRPLVEEQLRAGEKPSDTLGGNLLGNVKTLLRSLGILDKPQQESPDDKFQQELAAGLGGALDKSAEPLQKAGINLFGAADALKAAAEMLKGAANFFRPSGAKEAPGDLQAIAPMTAPVAEEEAYRDAILDNIDATEELTDASFMAKDTFDQVRKTSFDLNGVLTNVSNSGVRVDGTFQKIVVGTNQFLSVLQQLSNIKFGGGGGGGGLGGLLGLFSSSGGSSGLALAGEGAGLFEQGFGAIGSIIGLANGGMIRGRRGLPAFARGGFPSTLGTGSIPINKLRTGRTIGGPIAGVFGEEGSELVAKIKPNAGADFGGGARDERPENIYIVDQRRPNLGPKDVEYIITDNLHRGGQISRGVQNVVKRTKR